MFSKAMTFAAIICFVFISCANLMAQGKTGGIEFGIKAGLNLATASGDDAEFSDPESDMTLEPKTRMGIMGGLFLTFYLSDIFAIQPEILYSPKGTTYDFSFNMEGLTANTDITVRYDYLDIPVLAKVIFPIEGFGNFNIHAGPSAGIKILSEAHMKSTASGLINQTQDTTIKNEDAKGFVFNLVFGGGFGFDTSFGTISIEGRYNLALVNSDNKPEDATKEPDVKLNAISILASIAFK